MEHSLFSYFSFNYLSVTFRRCCLALLLALALPAWSADSAALQPVDINVASAEQLSQGLKGIGPSRAQAIVEYRKSHGKFARIEDLLLVKGIGPRVLEDNQGKLHVGK